MQFLMAVAASEWRCSRSIPPYPQHQIAVYYCESVYPRVGYSAFFAKQITQKNLTGGTHERQAFTGSTLFEDTGGW